jgi:putative restriction endonuclease
MSAVEIFDTGSLRQVDVWWEVSLADHIIRVLIDAKFRAGMVDVKDVEEVTSLAQAVGAHKAVIVAAHGWTDSALVKARRGGVDLRLFRGRGGSQDPQHPDNRGLRLAMERRLPLIYFHGIVRGKYLAAWPVFVVGDDPANLAFSVAVDEAAHLGLRPVVAQKEVREDDESARRVYVTAAVRVRLHQRAFRERVLEAYRRQCAFCRLRHEELLDAAHIVPDREPAGGPLVRNGLALCALHHAAFDRYFLGLRPDYVLEVRRDILEEHDGPTLVHAIQALHGTRIIVPRQPDLQPARELVEIRYQRFRQGVAA